MKPKQPYWQSYWYDLRYRKEGTAAFLPLGHEGLTAIPNEAVASGSLDEFVERLFDDCVDEMFDWDRGELQMPIYTEPTPGPEVQPVMVRSVMVGRSR
jgi:hypothetical protein